MNKYNIPFYIEDTVRKRDTHCVYCGKKFSNDMTFEHIDNDINNTSLDNIALCCNSCNASKGNKNLSVWLESEYCKSKNIVLQF